MVYKGAKAEAGAAVAVANATAIPQYGDRLEAYVGRFHQMDDIQQQLCLH